MLVGLEEVVCPHCRTPRDDMELEEGLALVRQEELRRLRRPKLIKAGLAFAALLAAAWCLRGVIREPLNAKWAEFQEEVEKTREPSHWLKDAQPLPVLSQDTPRSDPQPHAFQTIPPAARFTLDARVEDAPPKSASIASIEPVAPTTSSVTFAVAVAAPTPKPPAESDRSWYGVVYDLMTLQPLPAVRIMFKMDGQTVNYTMTDLQGHYNIALNRDNYGNRTLSVTVDNPPGYRAGVLEDRVPPLRDRSSADRKAILEETTDNDLEPVPLRYSGNADIVELDLVLVPVVKN